MQAFRYDGRLLRTVLFGVMALALSAASSSAAARGSGGDYLLTSPTLSINDVSKAEGDVGTTQFCFTISLSQASNSPVDVTYFTTDGTATTANNDYVGVSSTVQIPANQTSVQVCIDVVGDTTNEPNETFFVNIGTSTPGIGVDDGQGQGTIENDDVPTPTLLQAFDTETVEDGIAVTWQFANASTIVASWVERADVVTGPWTRVASETVTEDGMLKVTDRSVASEHTYLYRLTAQLSSGEFVKFGPIEAKSGVIVTEFAISQPSPNPTRNMSYMTFALPNEARVKLSVMDVQGREVAVLVDGVMSAGRHQAVWNASSVRSSGVYFVRYEVPGRTFTRRVVVTQ